MVKNKHIKVENENGKSVLLSAAIIAEYLKNYTSEWGNLSSTTKLLSVDDEYPDEVDPDMNLFNSKIGYIVPKIMLNSLIDEVMFLLKGENPEYLTMFKSFNNLEKLAIYFILMIKQDRTTAEVFNIINSTYDNLSKRDVMIKLLSEVDIDESTTEDVDPINGLYKLLNTTPTHGSKPSPSFNINTGKIEFKEFTFPMHSYNTTRRFGWIKPIPNDTVRNYQDRFNATWKANVLPITTWSNNATGPLHKNTAWETIFSNSITATIPVTAAMGGTLGNAYRVIPNYRAVLDTLACKEIYFNSLEEKPLFKYLGENFFEFNSNPEYGYYSLLTMTKYIDSTSTGFYFNKSFLKAGKATYDILNFPNLKTLLSYYASDINFWLTSDSEAVNEAYSDYLHTQDNTSLLTSNSKSETKGYFSNIMFIQSAIQKILYPRILKSSQNGYASTVTDDEIFNADIRLYDTIFDSIVNNGFVYTNKDLTDPNVIDQNYEIIPNRVILETKAPGDPIYIARDFTNIKSTNLYEFMINSLIVGKTNVSENGNRKVIDASDFSLFNRQSLLYKGDVTINYNPMNSKITSDTDSLTIADFAGTPGTIEYDFMLGASNIYNPSTNNWFDRINSAFFKLNDDEYSKINYRDIKFFKLPVHSDSGAITNNLNRNITRVNRELLTDISDIANFDIEGLSLADFTYGEKALLKEYINNYRLIKGKTSVRTYSDYYIINDMIKELNYLTAWKSNPTYVSVHDKANSYYQASITSTPMRVNSAIYFPAFLSSDNINSIKDLLNRSILTISKNRTSSRDNAFINQAKALIMNSAIDTAFTSSGSFDNRAMKLKTVGSHFLTSVKLIISEIKKTTEYQTVFDAFTGAYQTGVWQDTLNTLSDIKDVLIDDTLIANVIADKDLYTYYESGILKDLDIALYKLTIANYFNYISTASVEVAPTIHNIVFVDNANIGIIRYYSDIISLIKFAIKYHEMVPKYVNYLTTNILNKYYTKIKAIKYLPTWDYESFHRRDKETDLKNSAGINVHDYNIVWSSTSPQLNMIYRGRPGLYKVSGSLYAGGGLSYAENSNVFRDRWWKKWLTQGSDAFTPTTEIQLFKVPSVNVRDNNVLIPFTWEYNDPTTINKTALFNKMKTNVETYQSGKIANITGFKYSSGTEPSYENIGVPVLLLGDEGDEWNKANTIRKDSFSFETEFLNLWFPDKGYTDGTIWNNGGGEAYTSNYELVSCSDKYKKFGLGNMDLQEMFRHLWNMESSPMGNPYTVMNYDVFPTWNEGYQVENGDFPWSTVLGLFAEKYSNKYDFKFVLKNCYNEGLWSPVRLSGENRSIGVDPDVTNDQICDNFYLLSQRAFANFDQLSTAIFDIYNRNFRNRIYMTYLKWRDYNNQGAW